MARPSWDSSGNAATPSTPAASVSVAEPTAGNGTVETGAFHPVPWWRLILPGLLFTATLAALTDWPGPRHCGNVLSRYMTIESLAHRGTLAISESPLRALSGTPDVALFNRQFYSDKPPVLPALASVVYRLSGVTLSPRLDEFRRANWLLTVSIVGVSSGLALVGLRWWLTRVPVSPLGADLLTLGFGFTSLLLSYGVTFNNHSVAAGLVTLGTALALIESPSLGRRLRAVRGFGAGLCAGLAATIDIPVGGLLTLALGGALIARTRRVPWAFLAGLVGPVALHVILQVQITGTPWPVEMYPEALAYPGSYWATEEGRWKEVQPRWLWGVEFLFSHQGWLTVTPALVVGLVGLGVALICPGHPLRHAAGVVSFVTLGLVVYYVFGVRRCDFAGGSFGTRHMLAISPLVLLFAADATARLKRGWAWGILALLMTFGGGYAVAGMLDPWTRIDRPCDHLPLRDRIIKPLKWFTPYPMSTYPR